MIGFKDGSPAVLYLNDPKEKIWGLVVSVSAAGVVMRGLRLDSFEDWMRQEAKNEDELLGHRGDSAPRSAPSQSPDLPERFGHQEAR